jgi:hypothetical protein
LVLDKREPTVVLAAVGFSFWIFNGKMTTNKIVRGLLNYEDTKSSRENNVTSEEAA